MTTVAAARSRSLATPSRRAHYRPADRPVIRALDIVLSLLAILFIAPTLGLIALAVRLQDGGPVLFRQVRIGQGGAAFHCLKFRTMAPDAEAMLPLLEDGEWRASRKFRRDPRVTPLGRFLRVSSLDELPQLLNVLRGDMSLVGPRPIVFDEAGLYGRRLADYCAVRPGLTGLWQVAGRNDVPYPRRVAMDVWLVRNRSLRVYLLILLRTLPAVLGREGVY